MQKNKIFIHTNDKQMLGAYVGKYTMEKFSKHTDKFDVEFIKLSDYPNLLKKHGKEYLRKGFLDKWNNDDLQSFTPLRFLPPQLMDYNGRAIISDPDIFSIYYDMHELLSMDMQNKAIFVRKINDQKFDKGYYYASSMMLLDCNKLKHWDWDKQIEQMFSGVIDYRDWVSLYLEDESTIGLLDETFNSFDLLNKDTKILHNTGRLIQPWKTGLEIDFSISEKFQNKKVKPKKITLKDKILYKIGLKKIIANKMQEYKPNQHYRKHPDANQEAFFFTMVGLAINDNVIDYNFLQFEIKHKYIRRDAIEVVKYYIDNPFDLSILDRKLELA